MNWNDVDLCLREAGLIFYCEDATMLVPWHITRWTESANLSAQTSNTDWSLIIYALEKRYLELL